MNLHKSLNVFLKDHDAEIDVDGIFGQDTAQALVYCQMSNGITPDGVAGPETFLLLPNDI